MNPQRITQIAVTPEALDAASRSFRIGAERLQSIVAELESTVRSLDGAWRGESKGAFLALWARVNRVLRSCPVDGQRTGVMLGQIAASYREAERSATAATRRAEGSAFPTVPPQPTPPIFVPRPPIVPGEPGGRVDMPVVSPGQTPPIYVPRPPIVAADRVGQVDMPVVAPEPASSRPPIVAASLEGRADAHVAEAPALHASAPRSPIEHGGPPAHMGAATHVPAADVPASLSSESGPYAAGSHDPAATKLRAPGVLGVNGPSAPVSTPGSAGGPGPASEHGTVPGFAHAASSVTSAAPPTSSGGADPFFQSEPPLEAEPEGEGVDASDEDELEDELEDKLDEEEGEDDAEEGD